MRFAAARVRHRTLVQGHSAVVRLPLLLSAYVPVILHNHGWSPAHRKEVTKVEVARPQPTPDETGRHRGSLKHVQRHDPDPVKRVLGHGTWLARPTGPPTHGPVVGASYLDDQVSINTDGTQRGDHRGWLKRRASASATSMTSTI